MERSDALLARRRGWIVTAIVVLSVLVRLAYFAEFRRGPCVASAQIPDSDMRFFDVWAREIAGGDWLGARPLHPLHDWHLRIASLHLSGRDLPAVGVSPPDREAARTLWNDWYGGTRFHQEPLYPYAVALTYRILGPGAGAVYAWQMLLGVLSNLLIYLVARRVFSDTVGVVAAALAIGCGPLLFYETVLLRSASITFLGLLTVHVTQRAFDRGTTGLHLLAGVCAGLATLLKSTMGLLGLGAILLALVRNRTRPRDALLRSALVAAGIVACMLPVAARNAAVGAPLYSLSSVGAVTFLGANFEGNEPSLGFQLPLNEAARILGSTEGRLAPTVLATLGTHAGAGSVASLWVRKLGAALHGHEIPNNVNYYLCRRVNRVLGLMPTSFSWIAPLALAGLLAALVGGRGDGMLYWLLVAHLSPLLVFYVLSRFRAPLLAASIPFAAAALVWLFEWIRRRRWRGVSVLLGVVLLTAAWTYSPRSAAAGPVIRLSDIVSAMRLWYLPQSRRALEGGDARKAARVLTGALRLEPSLVEELLRGDRAPGPGDRDYLMAFARLQRDAATATERAGNREEARRLRDRAARMESLAESVAVGAAP